MIKRAGKTYNRAHRIVWFSAISVLFMLVSCHDDDYSMDSSRVTLEPTVSTGIENIISTRAEVSVSGSSYHYNDANVQENTVILIYALPNSDNVYANETERESDHAYGTFRYRTGKWRSSVTATDGKYYNLYGISPSTFCGATFNWGVVNGSFNEDNASITFNGLDVITSDVPMVSIAAAGKHTMLDDNDNDIEKQVETEGNPPILGELVTPTLTKGEYSIGKVVKPAEDGSIVDYYRVWMAMDHLYARATMSFCIDATYNEIRHIQINSAKVVVSKDYRTLMGSHTYSYTSGLHLDTSPSTPFGHRDNEGDLEVDLLTGKSSTAIADENDEIFTLTTAYKEYGWISILPVTYTGMPDGFPDAKLVVNYDVLCQDMNDPSQWKVVRDDQTVENRIPLTRFKQDDGTTVDPKPGDHFKIKIKIKPTYLYQLADDDAKLELIIE